MRTIKYIVVHCSATGQNATVESIQRYWKNTLKWKNPGYHYIVKPSGEIIQLLDEDKPSNGVAGYNSQSVNICYIGTEEQKAAMCFLLQQLKERYPKAVIRGHRDFSPDLNGNGVIEPFEWIKHCPCFDAGEEYKNIK